MSMLPIRIVSISFDYYVFDPRVRRLSEAAIAAGYSVDVLCLRQAHEKPYDVYDGVHVHRVPMKRSFGSALPIMLLEWIGFLLLATVMVACLHLKKRYDIVFVHNMPDFLIFSALFPKLSGARVMLDVQDSCPELMAVKAKGWLRSVLVRLATWQERASTAFADHIVTIGWTLEEPLVKRGVPRKKITSILNSADPRFFPGSLRSPAELKAPTEAEPLILMYHGTIAERQGLDIAIRAVMLASSDAPYIRLEIKGRGESLPALKQLVEGLGVSDKVAFKDMSPYAEIANFIEHGDIGIIPYRCDGYMELVLPTKAYEFALMQRPMISSDFPGIHSMFRSESIILCDATKPESFAEAIVDLYQNPEKRMSLAINAAQDYMSYRWEHMAERYQQLLLTLSKKSTQDTNPVGSFHI